MCLNVDVVKTKKARANKETSVIRYKVVEYTTQPVSNFDQVTYSTPVIGSIYHSFIWKKGWNKALEVAPRNFSLVTNGIHVVSKADAEHHALQFNQRLDKEGSLGPTNKFLVMEVKCDIKDLIAVGKCPWECEAEAYTQVYIEELPCV